MSKDAGTHSHHRTNFPVKRNTPLLSERMKIWLWNTSPWWWAAAGGILIGLNAPGWHTQFVGLVAHLPVMLMLEQVQKRHSSFGKRLLLAILLCWGVGGVGAMISAHWITNSAHVFGHLPWAASVAITGIGYGLEVGLLLFGLHAIPILLLRSGRVWDLLVRLCWFLWVDTWYPRLIHWNFGGLTFTQVPLLEQVADLIGASGMALFSIGLSLWLLLLWRRAVEGQDTSRRVLGVGLACYFGLLSFGIGYGAWRQSDVGEPSSGTPLQVISVQPNFSLQKLASNPDLTHSERSRNFGALLADSSHALSQLPENSGVSRLLVWPESTFPAPFFKNPAARQAVSRFAREHQTAILLASVDWSGTPGNYRFHGISVLVGPDGKVRGRYNKIFLIPFGETIPLSAWFPGLAQLLRDNIRNLSEFEAGREFTAFSLSEQVRLSAPICFDIFVPDTIRNMTRNGSQLAANLSNLAWFGQSTASDNMEAVLRWRAIENRTPVLFASNNGRSVLIGADGQDLSPRLELFEEGVISATVALTPRFSFYREYQEWVNITWLMLFLGLLWIGQRRENLLGGWRSQ
jgi:apolipoprotein N-acyltransferase